ncbi:MAG: aminotransferase class V-fold PLP-dependent enzyme [Anaerolineae bacterium]|nr:aminotransferase class V-fold PLP-dependent enzyme [Phycisphaerae bacterium]
MSQPAGNDDHFWTERRREMVLDPNSVNLNGGTLSPVPKPVFDAVTDLRRRQAAAPSDFCWRQTPPLINRARTSLANYLHCREADLLLLPNVTFAINIITRSLKLPAGSEILTSDHEYGAMLFCWQRFAREHDVTIRQITLPHRTEDPGEIVDAIANAISLKTSVVFFSHCTTSTGLILPAREITQAVRARSDALVIIDGAHAPGMVPLNLDEIDADFYGANCHKWLMAPAGSGFLHVAAQRRTLLESLITSWGWEYDRTKYEDDSTWGGNFWQRDLEFQGTLDRCPQMAIADALEFRESLGGDRAIAERCRYLTNYAREKLGAVGLTCIAPKNPAFTGSLISFEFPCNNPIEIRDRFWNEFHIECPVTDTSVGRFLRVSCAWFNSPGDLDRLAAAVAQMKR